MWVTLPGVLVPVPEATRAVSIKGPLRTLLAADGDAVVDDAAAICRDTRATRGRSESPKPPSALFMGRAEGARLG